MATTNAGARPQNVKNFSGTYTAGSGNRTATLTFSGSTGGNVYVDWGDGTRDTLSTHTYAANGTYTVTAQVDEGMTSVVITGTGWTALGTLPEITTLDISSSTLTALPTLPAGLKVLRMSSVTTITGALPTLPTGLEELNINGCTGLTGVASISLPSTMKIFRCRSLALTALPTLPAGLETLDCGANAAGLTTIAYTGTTMKDFIADTCSGLTTVPNFNGCTGLRFFDTTGSAITGANAAISLGQIAGASLVVAGTARYQTAGTGAYAQTKANLITRGWTIPV